MPSRLRELSPMHRATQLGISLDVRDGLLVAIRRLILQAGTHSSLPAEQAQVLL
jgi:hypothetical protein